MLMGVLQIKYLLFVCSGNTGVNVTQLGILQCRAAQGLRGARMAE